MAIIVPSALMLTLPTNRRPERPQRRDRESTSQTVNLPVPVTAASVFPSALNVRSITSPPVSSRGAPTGSSVLESRSRIPSSLRPDCDQSAVRAELPRMGVRPAVEPSVVRERERTSKPALPAEVPDDRAPVGARRVQRLPVGAEDRLPDRVRVPAQRLAGSQRTGIPHGDRPVAARRHDGLAVRAELQPDRARREGALRLAAWPPCAGRSAGSRRRGRSPRLRHPG